MILIKQTLRNEAFIEMLISVFILTFTVIIVSLSVLKYLINK